VKKKPAYAIDSVDHALVLATLLRQGGSLGVSEAAERLDVSPSTAHRLLAMLVYRDFAEQGPDRRYRCGPELRTHQGAAADWTQLSQLALPHLRALMTEVQETVNMQVLTGTHTRFIASVSCEQILRVGDRTGRVLPAHLTSGGKALLAALPADELTRRYAAEPEVGLPALRRHLGTVRRRGFAINNQQTEPGISAVGVALPGKQPVAAISLAVPSARFANHRIAGWVTALSDTAADVAATVATV
jgi:IclR family acetate operon transcriptional repressor